MAPIQQEGLSLYIHWPWCKKKCPYCDFNSHVAADAPIEDYLNAVKHQLVSLSKQIPSKHSLTSIFFGGGTPSLMPAAGVENLLSTAEKTFGFAEDIEITLEANPTSSEAKKFNDFVSAGVNRFSVGMQSLTESELQFLGREHSVTEAMHAIEAAQTACRNVNLDLIYGLPDQDLPTWLNHLDDVFKLGTQHISCYQLTIEKNTGFYADWRKGRLKPAPEHIQADFYEQTTAKLLDKGYEHYEVSNYAKPGYECKHNRNIWRYGGYLGIGAGAHGRTPLTDGLTATRNYKMPNKFITEAHSPNLGIFEHDVLSPEIQAFEATLLGLRLKEGLPLKRLEAVGGQPWHNFIDVKAIDMLVENGFLMTDLQSDNPMLYATPAGFLILDSVIEHLIKV